MFFNEIQFMNKNMTVSYKLNDSITQVDQLLTH